MSDMANIQRGLTGQGVNKTLEAMLEVGKDTAREIQRESADSLQAVLQEARSPINLKLQKKQKSIKAHKSRIQKMLDTGEKAERILPLQMIKDKAEQFQRRNPELKANILKTLREYIKPGDDADTILKKIKEFYPDVSLADEALEFLLETTEGALHQEVEKAKEEFNKMFEREIIAGKNIAEEARAASDKGLGAPTSLRDLYRDITGNPREPNALFSELSGLYAYKELKKVIQFLMHSLGADLRSKGPSIPHALLHRLIQETRTLQAILGVYRFFEGRMKLVRGMFSREGLNMPKQLTFEQLAKQFMLLAGERYPTPDKVLQSTRPLGIEKWIIAKIIALSQLRDAIRQVAMHQIYKSVQHRDDLYMSIIEALEDLEDELEELLEREEEEEGEEEEEEKQKK